MAGPTARIIGGSKSKPSKGQDDFASMAEVVRRRYTRVLNEANGADARSKDDDGGHAIPQELQTLVDETGRKVR